MKKLRYPRGYWEDIEHCKEAAIECGRRDVFQKEYPQAYKNLNKLGLLDEVLPSLHKKRTYERFMEIAKDCHSKSELKAKDDTLYQKAREKGWFKDCPWIPDHEYKPHKWTDEKRWEAAMQCSSRSEYCERFNGAWNYDNEHGLLDRYTHFKTPVNEGRDPDAEDYDIYVYPDYDNKVAYVGLTYFDRRYQRDHEHRCGRRDKDGNLIFDVVAQYWKEQGKPLPQPKYVMSDLHINDVGYYEGWYMDAYKKAGWKVLNIAQAGSLGGAKVKYNTYDAIAEKSKEYETRSQFTHGSSQAAKKARQNYTDDGIPWIDTFYWLKDTHEVRSEASRKRQTGRKLSEEHKRNIGISVKKYYANR